MAANSKPAPDLNIPKGETCSVSIINSTCDLTVNDFVLIEPHIEGKDWLNLPDWAFHIKNDKTGQQVVFDLGTRKDWWNSVPSIATLCEEHVPGLRVEKDVTEVLEEGGVKLSDLKALILSHWHFDHCGNITSLPTSVDLIVGPGFKDAFLPGYPTKQESTFWESDFKDRNVIEAPFNTKIGRFDAWDYFGDGSLYVLNVPGHATGHICALVRTTADTFIFMGGDSCHFCGMIRPTEYIPMPDEIPSTTLLDKRFTRPTPCSIFMHGHPNKSASRTTPFYECSTHASSFYADPPLAMKSLSILQEFDANPKVLTVIAHDPAPLDSMKFFPDHKINDWHAQGLKGKVHWHFLNEMPAEGVKERDWLVDGVYKDGKKIKTLHGEKV